MSVWLLFNIDCCEYFSNLYKQGGKAVREEFYLKSDWLTYLLTCLLTYVQQWKTVVLKYGSDKKR